MTRPGKPNMERDLNPRRETVAETSLPGRPSARIMAAAAVILIVLTLFAFRGTTSNKFLIMDDDAYVTGNTRVQAGITWDNVRWAFSTTYFGFYYPATWISHMLDCQIYGLQAGGHHLTSLLIHILNALLLLAALTRMTGYLWRSFFVAALFAVHPLHVESVAWVAERKDVLSTFFWFLCLFAYTRYAEKPSFKTYSLVFLSFLLGLLTKPMILTLPFTLLLLDYWPLRRWPSAKASSLKGLVWEKLPLFALIPIFSIITYSVQENLGAMSTFGLLPLSRRVANAFISYVAYLVKTLFPSGLTAYYPFPQEGVSLGLGAVCGVVLAALTVLFLLTGRERKYMTTGWLWYLGTLVPVIGLVQVGGQAMADRYTYVPLVGVFIIIVWTIADLSEKNKAARKVAVLSAVTALIVLSALSAVQVGYWRDDITVFKRMLAVTKENVFAHLNLGAVLVSQGKIDDGIREYNEAARIVPLSPEPCLGLGKAMVAGGRYSEAVRTYQDFMKTGSVNARILNDMGVALIKDKRLPEALESFNEAVRIDPGFGEARENLSMAMGQAGVPDEGALEKCRQAAHSDPRSATALSDLAAALAARGFRAEAIRNYESSLEIRPGSAKVLNELGLLLAKENRLPEAIDRFREAVKAEPGSYDARLNLGTALNFAGRFEDAAEQFTAAARIKPGSAEALNNLGLALAQGGKVTEAVERFREALRLNPNYAEAYINMGVAFQQQGRFAESAECFRKALVIRPDSEMARAYLEQVENALPGQERPE